MTPSKKNLKSLILCSNHYYCSNKGTSRERLCRELGLESPNGRRWQRKPVFFYKILIGLAPPYIQSCLLPDNDKTY